MEILEPRQLAFVTILKREMGKSGKRMSLRAMCREAGYSESVACNPQDIFQSKKIQNALTEFIGMLDDKRKMALTHMTEDKIKRTNAEGLARISDLMTKQHQLLTGGTTEREELKISWNDEGD